MRFSLKFVLGVILAASSLAAQSAPSSFSILIKLNGPTTKKVGSGVLLAVVLTNTSNEDLHFSHYPHTDLNYTVEVRAGQGQTPKAWQPETGHGSPFHVCVRPGKYISINLVVDNLFQMNEPGDYTIQLSRSSLEDPQHPVESNKVTVTITP